MFQLFKFFSFTSVWLKCYQWKRRLTAFTESARVVVGNSEDDVVVFVQFGEVVVIDSEARLDRLLVWVVQMMKLALLKRHASSACPQQSLTWIGSIHGLDWIGWDDCDPFLISNCCSTVDAVLSIYDLWTFNCPVLPRLKVSIWIVSGTKFTSSI